MTYLQLASEFKIKKNIYLRMDKKERESVIGIALHGEIAKLNSQLREYEKSIGGSHKPIGNYKGRL